MENFYTLLSNTGINAIIAARASNSEVKLTKIAVGDGEIIPSQDMTALKSEKHRFNINSIIQDIDNPNYLIVEGVIPSNVGGFYVSEVAIYTDQNTLFAIGSLPKTYKPLLEEGSAKDLTIKIFLEVTNADSVTLKVDDSVVLATRKFVLSELKKYALINGDETKKFKVADAVELNEAINKKQLEALQKSVNDAISNIQTLPIGAILNAYTIFDNCIVAFGGEFNRDEYPKLWAYLQANPSLVKTQTQWQTEATANGGICGFFSDGNGTTTFRVPNLDKAFLRPDSRGVASYQNDAFQGHRHTFAGTIASMYGAGEREAYRTGSSNSVTSPITDGTNGTPRTANETRPKNIAVLPLIVAN
ncbi:phage tail protein [Aliarcobacter butzleri]|uniref:Phage tail protein n=1 Tax=Aliarcobacter butzleri TaxID=28197 RepID=A0AAW7PUS1_9BACT|nr:phage tail protein [Aliarcobacter butzleri]MDN5069532.1 phage tail protein [Aliarcobacter butzleri]